MKALSLFSRNETCESSNLNGRGCSGGQSVVEVDGFCRHVCSPIDKAMVRPPWVAVVAVGQASAVRASVSNTMGAGRYRSRPQRRNGALPSDEVPPG